MLHSLVLLLLTQNAPADSVDQIIKAQRDLFQAVRTLEVRYTEERKASDKFIAEYARDSRRSRESVRAQFGGTQSVRWVQVFGAKPRWLLERTTETEGREVQSRFTIIFDGSMHWTVRFNKTDDLGVTDVTLGQPTDEFFFGMNSLSQIWGLTVSLSYRGPLYELLADTGGKIMARESRQGTFCTKVQFSQTSEVLPTRSVFWLDETNDFIPRQARFEVQNNGNWYTTRAFRVAEIGVAQGPEAASFPYPQRSVIDHYNSRGEITSTTELTVLSVGLNPELDEDAFRPDIEPGANMRNAATGKTWIYGDGPSQEITRVLERRVAQAKEQLQVQGTIQSNPRRPPSSWIGFLPWILGFAGIAGLALTVYLRLRSS